MVNSRSIVLELLNKMEQDNAYSTIILNKALTNPELTSQDKKFISALFYGVLEKKITLDYVIQNYSSKKINKLDKKVLLIFRMSFYQLIYMDSVPDSAVVNEAVKLVRKAKLSSASGFVNAVLRNFIRDGKKFSLPKDKIKRMCIEYSSPEWLVCMWNKQYGIEATTEILKNSIGKAPIYIRVNTNKISCENLIDILLKKGITVEVISIIENCLLLKSSIDIESLEEYKKGYFYVQDISSQLCCLALNPKENDLVFDICAAPGGKTFTISNLINNKGTIYAFDLHENRVNLINTSLNRLDIKNVKAKVWDGTIYDGALPKADKVLCDVPCGGLGVIRRKPEIKYKNKEEIDNLREIQIAILKNAVKYLNIGGELIYSTCSLNREENDEIIDTFLNENSEFEGVPLFENMGDLFSSYKATILPQYFNSDGFFISKIKKVR